MKAKTNTVIFSELLKPDEYSKQGLTRLACIFSASASHALTDFALDAADLKKFLKRNQQNYAGIIAEAEGIGPYAYLTYSPKIDRNGLTGLHCNNVFIMESFRATSALSTLIHQAAKNSVTAGANFFSFFTHREDLPLREFADRKLKAHGTNSLIFKTAAIEVDQKDLLRNTVRINSNNFDLMALRARTSFTSQNSIIGTGAFLTFNDNKKSGNPLAITPYWTTFANHGLKKILCLEEPVVFRSESSDRAFSSILTHASHYAAVSGQLLRWHCSETGEFSKFLNDHAESVSPNPICTFTVNRNRLEELAALKFEPVIERCDDRFYPKRGFKIRSLEY